MGGRGGWRDSTHRPLPIEAGLTCLTLGLLAVVQHGLESLRPSGLHVQGRLKERRTGKGGATSQCVAKGISFAVAALFQLLTERNLLSIAFPCCLRLKLRSLDEDLSVIIFCEVFLGACCVQGRTWRSAASQQSQCACASQRRM